MIDTQATEAETEARIVALIAGLDDPRALLERVIATLPAGTADKGEPADPEPVPNAADSDEETPDA